MYTTLISVNQLQTEIQKNKNLLLLDCRFDLADAAKGALDYAEAHLANAFYVDLEKNLSGVSNGKNGRHPLPDCKACAQFFASVGLTDETQVVVYDQGGSMFAARAWWILRWLGHKNVAVLDGGLKEWQKEGGEVTLEVPTASASNWQAKEPLTRAIAVEEVVENLETQAFQVVDARTFERFSGEAHPLDLRAGHIPHAVSYFFGQNLSETGLFKTPEELKQLWLATLGETPASDVIHQCGSGVTASVNALAMEHAGLSGSALYVGSWSEWAADEQYPVEV